MKTLIIELQKKIMDSDIPMLKTRPLYIELENMLSIINEQPNESRNINENEAKKKKCHCRNEKDMAICYSKGQPCEICRLYY